jgi:hypothetical protein
VRLLAGLVAITASLVIAVGLVWIIGHQRAASSSARPTSSAAPTPEPQP